MGKNYSVPRAALGSLSSAVEEITPRKLLQVNVHLTKSRVYRWPSANPLLRLPDLRSDQLENAGSGSVISPRPGPAAFRGSTSWSDCAQPQEQDRRTGLGSRQIPYSNNTVCKRNVAAARVPRYEH